MAEPEPKSVAIAPVEVPRARAARWGLPLIIAALSLLTFRFPSAVFLGQDDDSWNAALVYAHVSHLHFGTDIAFTYGPLGYLVINYFVTDTAVPRLLLAILLGVTTITGLCLLLWRMKVVWRAVFLFFFLVFCGMLHWAGDDLFMELGLLAWGLLCLWETRPRSGGFVMILGALAVVAALIKFNLAVVAALTIGTVAGDLAMRGRWRRAACLVIGCAAGWLVGWLMFGQNISDIGIFVVRWLQMAAGYNQAMSLDEGDPIAGFIAVFAALIAVAARVVDAPFNPCPRLRRALLCLWLIALLFLAWKYGYTRSDDTHLALLIAFAPMLALLLEALPGPNVKLVRISRGGALVCGVTMLIMVNHLSPSFWWKTGQRTYRNLAANVTGLLRADKYTRENTEKQQEQIEKMQLPQARAVVGQSTVDVFGQLAIFAVFNGMNYHPRPVLQSYAAYTPPLMELNEQYYLGNNAPEYILFELRPIDGRFAPVEDALAFRAALMNYDPVASDDAFLVLRHTRSDRPVLKLLREGDLAWDEKIDTAIYGATNLWLELNVSMSLNGRVRQFFYKPPEVQLQVWPATNNAVVENFRVPVVMLQAGFLANPIELTTQNVLELYTGKPPLTAAAYALDPGPDGTKPWQDTLHYRLYRIENKLAGHGD